MRIRFNKSLHLEFAISLNGLCLACDLIGETGLSLEYLKQALEREYSRLKIKDFYDYNYDIL